MSSKTNHSIKYARIRENTGQQKPVFSHILCSGMLWTFENSIFLVLRKLLSDEVETASLESESKLQKLFKSKFYHMKLLRKWSYLDLKNECSERLNRANFWVTKLKPFSGKVRQSLQDQLNSKLVIGSFLENGFEATLRKKTKCSEHLERKIYSFLQFLSDEVETIFWESKVKH